MIIKALVSIGVVLIGQFGYFYYKHRDDGGGNDGGMGSALLSIIGAAIGLGCLATAGLCAAFM
ncbi:MAG: hypothetical protein VB133_07440 [Anaeromusa sp.]|uniref:hypothetical protein n=1 Tax=Anaeromusa sp. TaxID=1872520 RepID=UPI002B21869A|nr:hypothetical protein [Anaeromusa sp.]MEA4834949.1 hypothetical protein [Anaeromusa sp.]